MESTLILSRFLAISAAATLLASPAFSKNIPIEIRWSGDTPTDVLIDAPGGFQSLRHEGDVFRGMVSVTGDAPQRHTITVRYGTYYYPFDVRVHRFLPAVSFAVEHRSQRSCTSVRVQEAATLSDNLPDTINRGVNAGELLDIPEPNRCDANLRLEAARAKYRQNVRMSHLSNGFFLINRQTEQQYEEIAAEHGLLVRKELAAYARQDRDLEARQLITVRSMAQAEGDYGRALQINDYILNRISVGGAVTASYRKQGVTNTGLTMDARYLQELATQRSAAAMTATTTTKPEKPEPQPQK